MLIIIAWIAAEVLQAGILLELQIRFFIRITILRLDDTCARCQPQRLGHISLAIGEQRGIALLDFQPGDRLCFLHPTVALFQAHPHRLLKIR